MTAEVCTSIEVAPGELSASLAALRLCAPEAQQQMQLSLAKLGQMTPVLVWPSGGSAQLDIFDGIKRWRAAQALSWPKLRVWVHALDAPGAKVRLLRSNSAASLTDLEAAWVVRSLYREDKLTQPEIAQLCGHDKSWVSRKLVLAEGLSDELVAKVRLGLISATAAVQLGRLQRCNQDAMVKVALRRGLTTRQVARLVDRVLAAEPEQWAKVLEEACAPAPPTEKRSTPRRSPGEQLLADAFAMKRLCVRLQARLLERSLESLGASACVAVGSELSELRRALVSLDKTIDLRLLAPGVKNAGA